MAQVPTTSKNNTITDKARFIDKQKNKQSTQHNQLYTHSKDIIQTKHAGGANKPSECKQSIRPDKQKKANVPNTSDGEGKQDKSILIKNINVTIPRKKHENKTDVGL